MKYKITLTILGQKWEQEGETINETLAKFPLSWENIKGKGILNITKGKKKCEKLMSGKMLRRIFSNKILMNIWSKNFETLLK